MWRLLRKSRKGVPGVQEGKYSLGHLGQLFAFIAMTATRAFVHQPFGVLLDNPWRKELGVSLRALTRVESGRQPVSKTMAFRLEVLALRRGYEDLYRV